MSSQTAHAYDLSISIPELLRVLDQKLGLQPAKVRGIRLPPAFSTASLEHEVSKSLVGYLSNAMAGSQSAP